LRITNLSSTQNVFGCFSAFEIISWMSMIRNDLFTPSKLCWIVTS
jgi:hypothetical protein